MHLSKDFFNFSTRPKPLVVKLPMLEKYIYFQVKDFNFKRAFFEKKLLPPPLDIFYGNLPSKQGSKQFS